MSDFVILQEMIKDAATVPLVDKYDRKIVTLAEPQHTHSSVTIAGIPDDAVVIKADVFNPPTSVFNDTMGECKRADFVIIADADNKKVILCIEMKAGKGGTEREIIQQLKGAQCFVAYCREIGRAFWNTPNFLAGYRYRFVSIRESSISKRPTRVDTKTDAHDRPDQMLKISGRRFLQFNHLAGGKY
jgi:hypothetical protein